MRRMLLVTLSDLIVVSLLSLGTVSAEQATPAATEATCDFSGVVAASNALKDAKEQKALFAGLLKLREAITAADIACNGLAFTGSGSKVLGPLVMPKGEYIVTAKTKLGFILTVETLTGSDCDAGKDYIVINDMNLDGDRALTSQSTFNAATDCRLVLKISNNHAPWTLTFEPLQ